MIKLLEKPNIQAIKIKKVKAIRQKRKSKSNIMLRILSKLMINFTLIFSLNNSKLKKDNIASFNLQAILTCPYAKACIEYCYATRSFFAMTPAIIRRAINYVFTQSPLFVAIVSKALNIYKGKFKTIRIHDSGDFYNLEYFIKWLQIAQNCPSYHFYAYTKSFVLIDLDMLPTNLKIIQSFGGVNDDKINLNYPHCRIFNSLDELLKAGYTDCSNSDLIASTKGIIKIGIVIH